MEMDERLNDGTGTSGNNPDKRREGHLSDTTLWNNNNHDREGRVNGEAKRRDLGDWPDNIVDWGGPDDPKNPLVSSWNTFPLLK